MSILSRPPKRPAVSAQLPPHLTTADLQRYTAQVFTTGDGHGPGCRAVHRRAAAAGPAVLGRRCRDGREPGPDGPGRLGRTAAPGAARSSPWSSASCCSPKRDKLIDLVQWETGKSRVHAGIEALGVASVAAHYGAESAGYLAPKSVRSGVPGIVQARVTRHPKGLVGVIAPWNYPLFLAVGDVIPALVAGNAVLSKADSQAPLTLLAARDLAVRAGLPADVWQVVAGPGSKLGQAIIESVDHLAFTGSTATGRRLAAAAGERLISTSLELGGKNPMIVREDANVDAAVTGAVQACFASAGQMCIGIERIYVHEALYPEFLEKLVRAAKAVRMGASYEQRRRARLADLGRAAGGHQPTTSLMRWRTARRSRPAASPARTWGRSSSSRRC